LHEPVLVLGQEAAEWAFGSEEAFMGVAGKCSGVLFCRVSSNQKAQVARLVKPHGSILATGDGGKDVNMLHEAQVGVGVSGREGSQAAQASDVTIPRFAKLIPLLAVHGHWTQDRVGCTTVYQLYKDLAMLMVYFWSEFDSRCSPTDFYDGFLIGFFNVCFTMLPPFGLGFWDRDHRRHDLLKYPQLCHVGRDPMRGVWPCVYLLVGLYQSLVTYYVIRPVSVRGRTSQLERESQLHGRCGDCGLSVPGVRWGLAVRHHVMLCADDRVPVRGSDGVRGNSGAGAG
jgi:magnesium-transporting ATPase (P-type)